MHTLFASLIIWASFAAWAVPAESASPPIWVMEIRGSINPASSDHLSATLRQAEQGGAQALVVELDTPGGLLSSVRAMAQAIDQSRIPVIVYVSPAGASATSAGALLMLASHAAVMAPGTNIGAAHPVGPQGEDIPGALGEKAVNDTAAFARGLASLRGRNLEAADLVVSKSRSFTAEEALREKLIEHVAPTREELLSWLDGRTFRGQSLGSRTLQGLRSGEATVHFARMTTGQRLLNLLANPNLAALLLSLGLLLIYVELSHPGITFAGVSGAICLIVAFVALQLLPIETGALALIVLGLALLAAEPFVISHGALAIGGLVAFALGLVWITDRSLSSWTVSPAIWVPLTAVLGLAVGALAYLAARTHALTLRARASIGGDSLAGLSGYTGHVQSVDADGRTGTASFRGELWRVQSETPLKPGDAVVAVGADTSKLSVRVRLLQPSSVHPAKNHS